MAGGSSAASARRAGKFNKPTRGGGKHYSRGLQPVDADGNQISMWSADSQEQPDGDEDQQDSHSEASSDEAGSDDAGPAKAAADGSREDRKAQKKARKEAAIAKQQARTVEVGDMPSSDDGSDDGSHDDMVANPNHSKAARDMAKGGVDDMADGVTNTKAPSSRREREAVEAAAAKEQYLKLQAQGKTDEAKADLARLRIIREQREAEAARRQAEKEEREEKERARRAETEAREAKKREAAAGPKKGGKKK